MVPAFPAYYATRKNNFERDVKLNTLETLKITHYQLCSLALVLRIVLNCSSNALLLGLKDNKLYTMFPNI